MKKLNKFKSLIIGALALFASSTATANELPGIYSAIEPLPFDPHGWFYNEFPLNKLFYENEIHTVIELGSWCGASTRFLAYHVGEGGKVYAIDTWSVEPKTRQQLRYKNLPNLFKQFLSNVIHSGLTDRIVPLQMTTDEALTFFSVKADLIYVDTSDETEQVYGDIINWYPHLNEGGIMCGNNWKTRAMAAGVKKAADKLGLTIEVDEKGNFWRLK